MRFDALKFAIKHAVCICGPGIFFDWVILQHLSRNAPDTLPFKILTLWCWVGMIVFSFMAFVRYSKELGGHERASEETRGAE